MTELLCQRMQKRTWVVNIHRGSAMTRKILSTEQIKIRFVVSSETSTAEIIETA